MKGVNLNLKKTSKETYMGLIAVVGFISFALLSVFFFATSWHIGSAVKAHCALARAEYEGDCVDSLIRLLDDEKQSYASRNTAIWALGQLGDERAKPVLEKYYTGDIPEKEPWDETLSQYELQKALALVNDGTNLTSWVWR